MQALLSKIVKFEGLIFSNDDPDLLSAFTKELRKIDDEFLKCHSVVAKAVKVCTVLQNTEHERVQFWVTLNTRESLTRKCHSVVAKAVKVCTRTRKHFCAHTLFCTYVFVRAHVKVRLP